MNGAKPAWTPGHHPRFSIGDEALYVSWDAVPDTITCPDCGGTRVFKAVMFDGTEHTLNCNTCERGYEGPQGSLIVYSRKPVVRLVTIQGVEQDEGGFRYRTSASHSVNETDLFPLDERPNADAYANRKAQEADTAERQRLLEKEKPTRTWAFHVSYHRREAESARKRAAYHEGKLAVAKLHAKEDRALARAVQP